MFDTLTSKLQHTFRKLSGKARLTEKDVDQALREVRLALLEADVHFKVVRGFIANVREKAVGEQVRTSLSPAQQVVKIVQRELTHLMGAQHVDLASGARFPLVIMLVGLQGAGKTTAAGKLCLWLRSRRDYRCLLAGLDPYRPAANEQLRQIADQVGASFHPCGQDPVQSAKDAVAMARSETIPAVILDTAGRIQKDEELMEEIRRIRDAIRPDEVLLVADATTGQEAVSVARSFHDSVKTTGILLTKMDGDARGGAALSMMSETQVPVKLIGLGEKLDQMEAFHPERMASRILGMGDVLTLIDKAQEAYDAKEAKRLEAKLKKADFNLEDFLDQLDKLKNMGGVQELMGLMPGMPKQMMGEVDDSEMKRIEAIILSMTPMERRNPRLIDGSRKRRIARGSGNKVADVTRLLHDFKKMRKMMRQMRGKKGLRGLQLPFG